MTMHARLSHAGQDRSHSKMGTDGQAAMCMHRAMCRGMGGGMGGAGKNWLARTWMLATLAAAGSTASAATLQVPAQFPTIQDAIVAASNGDTVLVAPGSYVEQVDFLGKSITLASSGGAATTTLSAAVAPAVLVSGSANARIEGFTITNVTGNLVSGGGIASLNSTLTVASSVLTNNSLSDGVGAAIYASGGTLAIQNSTISGNSAIASDPLVAGAGAAISVQDAVLTVTDSTLNGNTASSMGGGAIGATGASAVTVTSSTFSSNITSSATTGGAWLGGSAIGARDSATVTIISSTFTDNSSTLGSGGAVRVGGSSGFTGSLSISGSTFTNNSTQSGQGGAVAFGASGACTITTSTFTGNAANGSNGGAFATLSTGAAANGGVQIDECIFRNNRAGVAGAIQISSLAVISDSLFEDNEAQGATSGSFVLTGGSGAIRFSTAPNGTRVERSTFRRNIVRFRAGDGGGAIRASRGFLAIDQCVFENNSVEVNPSNNFAIHGGAVHLEGRTTSTLPVFSVTNSTFRNNTTRDTTLNVGGNGGAIFTTLRQSLTITGNTFEGNTSQSGGHVHVETTSGPVTFSNNSFAGGGAIPNATGQFGDYGAAWIVTTNASSTPMVVDNTTVSGVTAKNFGGITITALTQPVVVEDSSFVNVAANAISSSNGGDIGGLQLNSLNATLRRTTFTGTRGKVVGGASIAGDTALVEDCTFTDSRAIPFGSSFGDAGGLRITSNTATIRRTSFLQCRGRIGGGLLATGGTATGSLTLQDVVFDGCIAEDASGGPGTGGGARIVRGNLVSLDRVRFVGNRSGRGSGLFIDGALTTISNALFAGNTSTNSDGALAVDGNGSHTIVNTTIANNTGGALYVATAGNDQLNNSIIWGNTGSPIIEVNTLGGNPPTIPASFNIIQGGYAGSNLISDPLFAGAASGDFTLGAGSPAIDAGDNTLAVSGVTLDLLQQPRFFDDPGTPDTGVGTAPIVDMGAFESQGGSACDSVDFNNDGVFPDDQDLTDFIFVLGGGACATCNDVDFNNDGVFPDDSDLTVFLFVLGGGAC